MNALDNTHSNVQGASGKLDPDDVNLDGIDETVTSKTKTETLIHGISPNIYGMLSDEHQLLVQDHKVLSNDHGRAARALYRRHYLLKNAANGKRSWCKGLVRSNGQWFVYGSAHWAEISDEEVTARVVEKLREYYRFKLTRSGGLVIRAELVPWSIAPRDVTQVVEALQSVAFTKTTAPGWILTFTNWSAPSEFLRYTNVLPCANTKLDIDTREVFNHQLYFNTWHSPVKYNVNAAAPSAWLGMLADQWADDPGAIDLLQEWFGYALSGRTDLQKIMMLVGPPGSGKGIITDVLEALLGKGMKATSIKSLSNDFGLHQLLGASLAVLSDLQHVGRDTSLAVERLKGISGEDEVAVNRKNLPEITARIRARFMIIGNEIPRLSDNSAALAQRMLPLETTRGFRGSPDEDPTLKPRIMGGELPGILNWALDGLDRLNANGGRFSRSKDHDELFETIRGLGSPLADFINDHYEVRRLASVDVSDHDIPISEVHDRYVRSRPPGSGSMSKAMFTRSLRTYLRDRYQDQPWPAVKQVRSGEERPYVLRGMKPKPESDPMAGHRQYQGRR